jgi:primosomal protein N' (replication factor Y)
VAVVRPLRLKSEVFKRAETELAGTLPIARIWVDSGIYHLDQPFDYAIPNSMNERIRIGVRVEVSFNGKPCEGLVIDRVAHSSEKLKQISKIISDIPVATRASISVIESVAKRWAAHPYDILRSAIPPRVASVERGEWSATKGAPPSFPPRRTYIQLPSHQDASESISQYLSKAMKIGKILVVVPDSRLALRLSANFPRAVLLDSLRDRAARYRNFLLAISGQADLVIGTRSAIFAPLENLANIVVIDEGSQHHYERRSPGWNVRDVAILRSQLDKTSLTFLGFSPSSEVARLIELNWIRYSSQKQTVPVLNFPQNNSELLPGRIFSEIRSGLKEGSVLFLVPRKGYAQAISCAKCRNVALCDCGGKIFRETIKSAPQCALCAKHFSDWRCRWCDATKPFYIGRGSQRFMQEIGSAFPGFALRSSEGDEIIDMLDDYKGIVIATPGAIPQVNGGYSRITILEGDSYFSQSDIRSHERAREIFFSSASHLAKNGKMLLVVNDSNPIIGALSSWKPSIIAQRELRERKDVLLPPFSRALTVDSESREIGSILKGLEAAVDQGRLPVSTKILGPLSIGNGNSRIILTSPVEHGEELIRLIHEFQRKRSASRKTLSNLRIDPYSLTR